MFKTFVSAVAVLVLVSPLAAFAAVAPVTTVTATADAGSIISPFGAVVVATGDTQVFNISANNGFHLTNVTVDGSSAGTPSTVGITGDGSDHSISVASASSGGGSLVFCSGPEAPGYTVGKVGGGCGGTTTFVPYNGTSCLFMQGCMIANASFLSVIK
jgi:hypothetical protein